MYKKRFVQLVYGGVYSSNKLPLEKLTFAFFDTKGRAYYTIEEDKIPALRKINLALSYIKLVSGINEQDFQASIDAIQVLMNEKGPKNESQPNLAKIGWICMQLNARRNAFIVPDHLYELAANYFIREDEDFALVEEGKLLDKIDALKQMPFELMKDFFFSKSLNTVFPDYDTPDKFLESILYEESVEALSYLKLLEKWTKYS